MADLKCCPKCSMYRLEFDGYHQTYLCLNRKCGYVYRGKLSEFVEGKSYSILPAQLGGE